MQPDFKIWGISLLEKLYLLHLKYILQSESSGKKTGIIRRDSKWRTGSEVKRFIGSSDETDMLCDLGLVFSPPGVSDFSSIKIGWGDWLCWTFPSDVKEP